MGKRSLSIVFLAFAAACASGHCRSPSSPPPAALDDKKDESSAHIFVAKPDGSVQCNKSKGVAPDEMKDQLKGIMIYTQAKKRDGLMHPQVCGSPTGWHNVFEISAKDLPSAEKAGFKKWLY